MRRDHLWSCVVALAMMVVVVSTVQAQSSGIAFSSDRSAADDTEPEIWKMGDEGEIPPESPAVEMTEQEYESHNPSIANNGYTMFYDYRDTELWMADFNSPGNAERLSFNAWDPDSLTLPSIGGPRERLLFTSNDFDPFDSSTQIWMVEVDVDDQSIDGPWILMTPHEPGNEHSDKRQAAFCGSNHFVWVKDTSYGGGLCYQEFISGGPVGDEKCELVGTDDGGLVDEYPSCNPAGTEIAWARETGYK